MQPDPFRILLVSSSKMGDQGARLLATILGLQVPRAVLVVRPPTPGFELVASTWWANTGHVEHTTDPIAALATVDVVVAGINSAQQDPIPSRVWHASTLAGVHGTVAHTGAYPMPADEPSKASQRRARAQLAALTRATTKAA